AEIQALVDGEVAQAKIEAYAADNTQPAPTAADYAAIGVTGVTAGNLADVNAAVDATDAAGVDTLAEIQALVDGEVAQAKIEAYAADNTQPAPTAADYAAIGVTGVAAGNLAFVNAAVDATDAAGVDTLAEIQALVDGVPQSVIDLSGEAGFIGQLINPVQVLINGQTRTFYYWDRDGSGDSGGVNDHTTHDVLDDLFNNGSDTTDAAADRSYRMADGTQLRLPTLGTSVARHVDSDETVSSEKEDQTVLDGLAAIKDAFDGTGTASGAPAGWASRDYWSATSTGAGEHASLVLVNGRSVSQADGHSNYVALEVLGDGVVAQEKIEAYAADNRQPAPTAADYAAIGVTGVTAGNLADVNAAVDATDAAGVNTLAEIQALVGEVVQAKIEA
ncbi:MAG: hypothetical protein GY928_08850, partial [Colwellia sp.]|nr:hypothetical protein [Colwellia sp.]